MALEEPGKYAIEASSLYACILYKCSGIEARGGATVVPGRVGAMNTSRETREQ